MNVAARNADYCATLVDEWAHLGLRHAFVAPGSRSAPLALALARDPRVTVTVMLDERGAAFTALGAGRATGRPALVLCTSGTAATHFHAAVVEAHHAGVPLLVVTADRPPELHGIGAPQTIEQAGLYGGALRMQADPGPPETGDPQAWRALAARAYAVARGERPGPVHVNLAFREPLVGAAGVPRGRAGARADDKSPVLDGEALGALGAQVRATPRGVIVVGWGSDVSSDALDRLSTATGWPVLADALSNARAAAGAVRRYEALVRVPTLAERLRPDMVLRFGAALTSKIVTEWLAPVRPHVMVDPRALAIDPTRSASTRLVCDGEALAVALAGSLHGGGGAEPAWRRRWLELDRCAAAALDAQLAGVDKPTGPQVARTVAASMPPGSHLVVASSMPVRDLDWFAGALDGVRVHANRGVNGIDGTIATASGVAAASGAPTVALVGDLAFLHDAGSLVGLAARGVDLTIVAVDNDGGGIFSFLAQREHSPVAEFELLFGTPQGVDLVAIARAYGLDSCRVERADGFGDALAGAVAAGGGTRVIVVPVLDRDADVAHHRELWAAAARAVGGLSDGGGAGAPPSVAAGT